MFSRIKILLSFALRDISKSRTTLILTVFSLTAIFTAVILSTSILDGFQATLQNGSINTGGHLTVKPAKGENIKNIDLVQNDLGLNEEIEGYSTRSHAGLIMEIDGSFKGVGYAALGVDPMMERSASQVPNYLVSGRYLLPSDERSVVIGVTLADLLSGLLYDGKEISVGEEVRYISPLTGKARDYTVVGIVDTKYFHSNWSSYFPKKELEWLDNSKKDSEIIVRLKDPSNIEDQRQVLQNELNGEKVFTWNEKEGYIFNIVMAIKFITGNISNLLIITAFVIVSVIIYINVSQRRRQIGIIKSMGAKNSFVVAIYMVEALVYFILSFLLAFLVFLLIHIFFVNNPIPLLIGDFRTVIVKSDMVKIFFILILSTISGSMIPSYIAARTQIVNVLRGES